MSILKVNISLKLLFSWLKLSYTKAVKPFFQLNNQNVKQHQMQTFFLVFIYKTVKISDTLFGITGKKIASHDFERK